MATEHVPCSICGRMTTAPRLAQAGSHALTVKTVMKGLGRGKGFEWAEQPMRLNVARALEGALLRALAQVQGAIQNLDAACRRCGGHITFLPARAVFGCTVCGKIV